MIRLTLQVAALVGATLLSTQSLPSQTPIRVVTLGASRFEPCLGTDRHFFSSYYDQVRAALLAPANFGPGGIVSRPIELQEVAVFDATTLASADVVLAVAAGVPLQPGELMLINSFVRAGGGLFLAENRASTTLADMVGATESASGLPGVPVISNTGSPMVTGPFGTAGALGVGVPRGFGGSFLNLGPLGTQAVSLSGESFAATFSVESGRIAAICDEEVLISLRFGNCAADQLGSLSQTLFFNSMAWVAPAPGFSFGPADVVFTDYGSNCNNGVTDGPFLTALGSPAGSGVLTFRIYGGAASAPGVLILGMQRTQLPLLGCDLLVDQIFATVSVLLGPSLNRPGDEVRFSVTLPGAISGTLDAQAFVLDSSSPTAITATQGAEVRF